MSISTKLAKLIMVSALMTSSGVFANSSTSDNDDSLFANGRLAVGAGIFGVFDNGQLLTLKLGYEFAPLSDYWEIRPLAQFMVHDRGAYHVSVGAIRDFEVDDTWSWGISTSVGYYHEDSSNSTDELGYDVEFYSAISATYKLDNQSAVRAELGHISNGSLGDRNPGSESIMVSYLYQF